MVSLKTHQRLKGYFFNELHVSFKRLLHLNKMILVKSYFTEVLHDCFKLAYANVNEGDKVRKCYSCLKLMMQAHI